MNINALELSERFLDVSMKLQELCESLELLKKAKIKYECNLDGCYLLLKDAALGNQVSIDALEYSIKHSAKQLRISIQSTPRWYKIIEDIRHERENVNYLKLLTYRALLPLALKEFE
jgi:hypothetical protein